MKNSNPRSHKYQYQYYETGADDSLIEIISSHDPHEDLSIEEIDEILNLQDLIKQRMYEIIKSSLSEQDQNIINQITQGKTQSEISKSLKRSQTHAFTLIEKIKEKLKKECEKDDKITELFFKIEVIKLQLY